MAKYQEVIGWITERIDSGALAPGMKIPSENELCNQFRISRQTARHAIGRLEAKGVLTSRRGSGTYVSDLHIQTTANRQKRIAVITTYLDGYIFPRMIQGIESKLNDYGYSMQIAFTNNTFERERSILEDILQHDDIAGMIVEPTKSALPNPNLDLYRELISRRIPILFVNSYYPELSCPHVSMDDRKCAYRAVKMLTEHGHRKIGCILKLDDGQGHARYSGYLQAMKEAGNQIHDDWIVWLDTEDLDHMEENREKICRRLRECTGVFAYNDQVAVEVIRFLREKGIRIPEQMSVVSIDDSDLAQMNGMGLDSVPHPKEKLGAKAAENLVHLIHNAQFGATHEFEEDITVRSSVRNINTDQQ